MKPQIYITHEFVDFIPSDLKDGKIYVSIPFTTVVHKCFCGCGQEVVTPLSPTDWKLIFDGKTISLEPSIGNWSFNCQSHYWIKRNKVIWVPRWSKEEIKAVRNYDKVAKEKYFDTADIVTDSALKKDARLLKRNIWQKIKDWWI